MAQPQIAPCLPDGCIGKEGLWIVQTCLSPGILSQCSGCMNYPLQLRFKFFAFAPQFFVQDMAGADVCYVKQKLFRLREKVEVFSDSSRTKLLSTIQADRIIDFNSCYSFHMADGTTLGSVRRRGLRSLWSAHYEILDGAGNVVFEIREQNPIIKFVDGLIDSIPVVGLFTGYFLHPRYAILRNGSTVLTFTKTPSFIEGRFVIEKQADISGEDEMRAVLSVLMFVLLERKRG
jgi:uncharacterized protein YxjI